MALLAKTDTYWFDHSRCAVTQSSERSERKSDEIARYVTTLLEQGELAVGDRLPSERDLSQTLMVSRPLVREGYRILESLGVVEVRQGSGVYVSARNGYDGKSDPLWDLPVSMQDILEVADAVNARCGELAAVSITDDTLRELRKVEALQKEATQRFDLEALAQLDTDFHRLIVRSTGNPILESFEALSRRLLNRDRVVLLGTAADRSLEEHGQIIHALEQRNPLMARLAMQHHSVRSHAVMSELLDRPGSGVREGA